MYCSMLKLRISIENLASFWKIVFIWAKPWYECAKKKPKKELSTSFHSSHWVLHVPISSERHNRFFMTCHQHKICFQKPFTLFPLFMKTALRFTQQQCTQIVDSVFQFDVSDILNFSWQVYKTIENFWIYLKISMKFTQKIIIIFFSKGEDYKYTYIC